MNRDDEVQCRQDRREAGDESRDDGRHDIRLRLGRVGAVRRVEGPAGVDASRDDRENGERAAGHEEIPAREIQFRKRHVARADHHREKKISENRRDRRNEEEPNHHDAVNGEEFVVGRRGDEIALRREQFQTHHRGRCAANEKENRDRHHVEKRDPFVIGRQEPGADGMRDVEIVGARFDRDRQLWCLRDHLNSVFASPSDFR